MLHQRMLALNHVFGDFVTGAKCGKATFFFGCICRQDVRLILSSMAAFRGYALQCEKDATFERCFVLYWEDNRLKKVFVGCEFIDKAVPRPELILLAHVVCSLESRQLPLVKLEEARLWCAFLSRAGRISKSL